MLFCDDLIPGKCISYLKCDIHRFYFVQISRTRYLLILYESDKEHVFMTEDALVIVYFISTLLHSKYLAII